MRTEQIRIYKFDELNEEAKEKAIENQRSHEGYLDYEWFSYLHEGFIEELNTIGVNCKGFFWDLYQGKEFKAEELDVTDEQKLLKSAGLTKWLIINELRKGKTEIYNISLSEYGGAEVEIDDFNPEDNLSDEEYSDREKEVEEIEDKITEFMKEKFEKFWETLNKDYEYLMSDEGIKEDLEMNEYEFNESGERW